MSLPETTEKLSWGNAHWRVKDKGFVWERPLRKTDFAALGDDAPDAEIIGVRVEHLGAKEAMLQSEPSYCFTIPHFEGYPAVLVRLDKVSPEDLEELVVEAWLVRAPPKLARAFMDERGISP